jgi:hypothetical protein
VTETAVPHTAADPLAELVRSHQQAVWRWLRSLGCPPAEADDLTAETFVVAHRKHFVLRSHAAGEENIYYRLCACLGGRLRLKLEQITKCETDAAYESDK